MLLFHFLEFRTGNRNFAFSDDFSNVKYHEIVKNIKKQQIRLIQATLLDKISSDNIVLISAWCLKFCLTKKNFLRKLCLTFQYRSNISIQVRQKLDKIDEISGWRRRFCLTKNFVSRKFVRQIFVC